MSENGHWGIVSLMGHKVLAGYVCKDERYGAPMLRIDVPETEGQPEFSRFVGLSGVYDITPVSEEVARMTAESCKVNPVSVYMPELVTVEKYQEAVQMLEAARRNQLGAGEDEIGF